ncbi:MAG: fluoride efflux transporter CrcB [Deltaproteobacteria bacterium]|nr:fluoride efflux transporter CrcB [Deltaproteobacteria bacterium]
MKLLWISLGGAAGTAARYLISGWTASLLGPSFPYGTLMVNVTGSFLLAFLMQLSLTTELLPVTLRLALTTGVLGGYTTYSTFSYETFRYFQEGAWLPGGLNVLVTVTACLIACLLGFALAKWITGG